MPRAIRTARTAWAARRRLAALLATAGVALAFHGRVVAQEPEVAVDAEPLSAAQLDELVAPIALYPDDLIAIVLPASTYPLQIVQAARFLEERKSDPSLQPHEEWDDSVVALLNYPEVVELLNRDLDWTWRLGEAVLAQRADVLDAVQRFRDRAYAAGNLRSDERQTVTRDGGVIAIKPADPQVIYVPYYGPETVVVRHAVPVYHYYPVPYPVYYYPYPAGYHFHTGFFWGVTTVFSIGWHSHLLHVHHHHHHLHPFFGWHYHEPFFVRRGLHVHVNVFDDVWRPRHRYGSRPHYNLQARDGRVTRSREGYVNRAVTRGDSYSASRSTGYRASRPSTAAPTGGTYRSASPGTRAPAQAQPNRGTPASRPPTATYRSGAGAAPRAPARVGSLGDAAARATQPARPGANGAAAPRTAAPRASVAPGTSVAPRTASPRSSVTPRASMPPARTSIAPRTSAPPRSAVPRAATPRNVTPTYRSSPSGRSAPPRASAGSGRQSSSVGSGGRYRSSGGVARGGSHGGRQVR
ncbi:MAG TPA: DUF3300 domain-containing protein [Gammaproteobacteria bacterium]